MSPIKLNIVRGDEAKGRNFIEYEIPYSEGISLLDAIFWIREHVDSSLSVRYSCRSANACKECMAMVDGKVQYLCSIRASDGQKVSIEPLKSRQWVKDLTTVME
ncbi:2Fe-2S iron-sulfur cluster-binding protein [Paenisporosarcina indica]|uniref:2Fe-2S iron-sulfur cluster-binding protein n=1 Tax=Paenisporosarcina indica TaxID=650093 RepID=UPI00094F7777|nr:2Fe-2S iron-sulfur cluster-binding protein [Paenisporosarcina indica]